MATRKVPKIVAEKSAPFIDAPEITNGSKNGNGKHKSPKNGKNPDDIDPRAPQAERVVIVRSSDDLSHELLRVLTEMKNGNLKVRMPIDETSINGKICDTLNDIISFNEKMMIEFSKASI